MSPTSYQAALPRVIPSLLSATLIIIPYSNGFVKRVRKVFLQRKQRMKTRLLTFFPESQQPRQFTPLREGRRYACPPCRVLRRISIHAPPRGATAARTLPQPLPAFQFTPLREGRPRLLLRMSCWHYFNSRPSARGDANPPLHRRRTHYFNSRPSARGDQVKSCIGRREKRFQFTPLREGRRLPLQNGVIVFEISIHAPPRGATEKQIKFAADLRFQFTPLREGRPVRW